MHSTRGALLLLPILLASCSKAPQAPHVKDPMQPDEATGVQGVCVRGGDRRPVAGALVELQELDAPAGLGLRRFSAATDAAGRFRLPVQPGRYALGVADPAVPGGKAHAPLTVAVEKGRYAEVEVDVGKLDIREPAKGQPTR